MLAKQLNTFYYKPLYTIKFTLFSFSNEHCLSTDILQSLTIAPSMCRNLH